MASDSDSKIGDFKKIVAGISDEQVLKLEQAAIRIPSTTFEEGEIADHFANYMSDVGLDVEMRDVTHPAKPGKTTRQPIARLKGTGGGPSLMLNGHMDPGVEMSGWSVDPYSAKFEDGWVWGMGASGAPAVVGGWGVARQCRRRQHLDGARHSHVQYGAGDTASTRSGPRRTSACR
jgi:hypothetical protein